MPKERSWFLCFPPPFSVSSSPQKSPFVPSLDFYPFLNVLPYASISRHLEPIHYDIFRLIESYSPSNPYTPFRLRPAR